MTIYFVSSSLCYRSWPICPEILRLSALPDLLGKTVRRFQISFSTKYKQTHTHFINLLFFLFPVFHWQATIMGPVSIKLWHLCFCLHSRTSLLFMWCCCFLSIRAVHPKKGAAHFPTEQLIRNQTRKHKDNKMLREGERERVRLLLVTVFHFL